MCVCLLLFLGRGGCAFGFEFENFEIKEICEPGVMVSLYGLESLGFGGVLPRGALGMSSSNSSSCSMWVMPPPSNSPY